jgi:integrator complex subunit 7
MQGTAIEVLVELLCSLKQGRSDQTITILKSSTFAYTECQDITNRMSLAFEENGNDRHLYKIIAMIMNHNVSLVNKVIDKENKKDTSRSICISSDLKNKYKVLFSLMLKLVTCYPSSAVIVLEKLRWLVKELAPINGGSYCDVVTRAESFQKDAAFEELDTASNNAELLATTTEASLFETDSCKSKIDSAALNWKKNEPVIHDLILWMLKCANACHDILCKISVDRCSLHNCIKDLIGCVHQHASQYWSTYETFHMIMCACIARNTCKSRDNGQEPVDSKEVPKIFLTHPVWIAQELCALRMTKMLAKKQKYWEAYRSSMYCCCTGLWFTASFVFRKLADAFEPGSFSFWYKSLLLFSAGEIEMKLLLFPSATIKLVGELKAEGDLSEDLYCAETDADSTPIGSQELHGYRAKIIGIRERTILANDALVSNASSHCDFVFQRWFISLRSSFLEVLTDVFGILSAHSSYEAREGKLTVPEGLLNDQVLALAHCSLRLGDLAKSYDLLAASHMDMDHHSFNSIARLAFMCSLLAFCTAYSVDLSKVYSHLETCKFLKKFSRASVLQDLQGRVDGSDWQIISQLRQFMSTSFRELGYLQSCTRMCCSGNLEKDLYSLCCFAVASLLRVREDAKVKETTNGEDCLSALHGGLQFLSGILLKLMELPFVVPKYFFRVRYVCCFIMLDG